MFQEITHASGNLHSSLSLKLAEDLSQGSTPGSLRGPGGRHSDWDILGKFVVSLTLFQSISCNTSLRPLEAGKPSLVLRGLFFLSFFFFNFRHQRCHLLK